MGFSEKMVVKVIDENGEGNIETILDTLLTNAALKNSPPEYEFVPPDESDLNCSDSENCTFDDISDGDICQEDVENLSHREKILLHLVDMGFLIDDVSSAIDACGPETSIMDLIDFINVAQMAKTTDDHMQEPPGLISNDNEPCPIDCQGDRRMDKKRKRLFESEDRWEHKLDLWKRRQKESREKNNELFVHDYEDTLHCPKVMIGFGVPNQPMPMVRRSLPEEAIGPPFFYYENVACTPKGVWSTISRFLYEVEPEFVDSLYFSACARKRGYVHNLPIHNRYPLLPIPPLTIQEALPLTRKWWPSWDPRTKLNCLQTTIAGAKLTERIKIALENWDDVPPLKTQKYVLYECKKWNLVWIGKNKVAPLEPDEMEMLLGYPKNYTRGGGASRTERYKALGNAFQVDTVAFHFSVLKSIFPNGISILSLFSGIGGAEVALHQLGIPLKNVVSVEISEISRNILRSWWEETNQKGKLIEIKDIKCLDGDRLEKLVHAVGGFDLVVGGSPCNNLTGGNRVSREGLAGEQSILFYDYCRVLDTVKCIMRMS